jgi:hypothetical protein
MLRVQTAEKFRAPAEQAESIVNAKLQPVYGFRITSEIPRWMYVFPIGKAVTMPRGAKDVERAVFGFEPVPAPITRITLNNLVQFA